MYWSNGFKSGSLINEGLCCYDNSDSMRARGWLITILGSFQGLKVAIKYGLVNSTASVQGTRHICPSKMFSLWHCRLIGNLIIAMLAHSVLAEANGSEEHLCNRMLSNCLKIWSAFTENTGYPISTNTWTEQWTQLFFQNKKNRAKIRGNGQTETLTWAAAPSGVFGLVCQHYLILFSILYQHGCEGGNNMMVKRHL